MYYNIFYEVVFLHVKCLHVKKPTTNFKLKLKPFFVSFKQKVDNKQAISTQG